MKKKNRPGRTRVSKVPPKPSSLATRAFNVMANLNYTQGCNGDHFASTEDSDHLSLAESFERSQKNVEETERGTEPIIVDAEDDTMTSIVPETPNSCDVDDGYNDKEAAPDKTEEATTLKEKPISLNSPSTWNWDLLEMSDSTLRGRCIKCNEGGDQVLICSGNGCLIGIHTCCLRCPPTFDDVGNFYCPLCSYKRAVSELHEVEKEAALAKEKVQLVRKSFSLFVSGSDKKESTERIHERELNQSRMDADRNGCRTNRQHQESNEKNNFIGLAEDQQEATTTTGCSNGNLGKETSLASERNDILLTGEGDHAKQVGNHQWKSMEDQQEAVVAVGCSFGNLMVEKPHESKSCDTSLSRGKRSKQVDYHHCKNIENQQEAVAAVGVSNGNLGVETSLISERNDASHGGDDAEQFDGHRCESVVELRSRVGPSVSCGSDNVSCGEDLPLCSEFGNPLTQTKENETEMVVEHQHPKEGEQQMQVEANIGFEYRNSTCRETETVSVHAQRVTRSTVSQPRVVDPVVKSPSNRSTKGKKTASSKSVKSKKSARCPSNPALPNSRRKKLPWTHEEEEMLKEAVKKASSKVNKNIPWKIILDSGCKVFNESRTPSDLKDKWRNMAKEGSRARRR
ncbi:SANT/Myb domain [Macleaya cordata]|uniref:SANT/Myb domain n=1 Tax=Macleaya cordata TaxID=56857 RepID=A0A200RAG3_MACCD|nr:SANT/Myb domain [Macleaya cordata]